MANQAEVLKRKLKTDTYVEGDIYLRLHRAISWLKGAEEHSSNSDIQFICLWISFNSCYAVDSFFDIKNLKPPKEIESLNSFLVHLISCDQHKNIYSLIWNRFSSEIRVILENKYLFKPFWDFHRGEQIDYKSKLQQSIEKAHTFLAKSNVVGVLNIILERLYVLRNQILHGGATYKSSVNRKQIKDASQILSRLLPIIIEIMIDNKEKQWGFSYYPVIK